MANSVLTTTVIAKEALMILDNELVMAKQVYRGLEKEYGDAMNGYQAGASVNIKRPTDFTVRSGATSSAQDVVEGTTSITVDQQKGVDFAFTSQELTLNIKDLSERVIRPAMIQLANQIDADLYSMYNKVPNWVGTPGNTVNSFTDLSLAPQRLDEYSVPAADRSAVLSPADHWGLLGSQTSLYIQDAAKGAYRNGSLGMIGGVDTYMAQNVPTHTVGALGGTPLVNGASQGVTYASVKDTAAFTQSLITDGWSNSVTGLLKSGDIITMTGVYAVNPVTKATQPFLKQFVVTADAASNGSGQSTLTIYPAMIVSGAFQNVSAAPADNAPIQVLGTAATGYRQNLVFHKNAFALAVVPMIAPPGAVDVSRESYKGTSVRMIPFYNGSSDVSTFRLDVLYGFKALDPRLATRLSGTP